MRLRGTAPMRERRAKAVEYTVVTLTVVAIITAAAWLVAIDIMSH